MQTNLDFDDDEEQIISKYSKDWDLNKPKTIKKIVREFERRNKNEEKKESS